MPISAIAVCAQCGCSTFTSAVNMPLIAIKPDTVCQEIIKFHDVGNGLIIDHDGSEKSHPGC